MNYPEFLSIRRYCIVLLILVSVTIIPVGALPVATNVGQGATIFIGEEGLNVTSAMNSAAGNGPVFTRPNQTTIGWWPSEDLISSTSPVKLINMDLRYSSFTVAPSDFVGYTGKWYLMGPDGYSVANDNAMVFYVADPNLDVRIWDLGAMTDLTGNSAIRGTKIGFRINTNMYPALYSVYRSPVSYNNAADGYIDIVMKDASGNTLDSLADSSNTFYSLTQQNVSIQPYVWGNSNNPIAPTPWDTGILKSDGQYLYPIGTYSISAVSTLNNMRTNYKIAGADYTGKTVSPLKTVTLLPAEIPAQELPVPDFTSNVTSGMSSVPIGFSDTSSNNPEFFYWSFGDGWYSNERNPVHTYTTTTARNYTVTHIAWNTYGSTNKVKTVVIRVIPAPLPKANFAADVTTGTSPLSVQFTDISTNSPASWNWSFGDGKYSIQQNPVHVYTSSTTRNYSVSLTVTNGYGSNKITKSNFIRVLKK